MTDEELTQLQGNMATAAEQAHGRTCIKVPHIKSDGGYLHAPDDDGPFDVDNVWYCGRCHAAIPEPKGEFSTHVTADGPASHMQLEALERIGKPARRGPNKWEAEYAAELEQARRDIPGFWFGFESVKLRLADSTFYTPDFMVRWPTGLVEFHEVKGFLRDDAAVKFKVAAEMFPWATFKMFRKRKVREGGGWEQIR